MNQLNWSLLRPQHQLALPPSSNHNSISRQPKPKQKVTNVASKSFSQSFLNQYSYRKINNTQKRNKQEHPSKSMQSKNKKLSQQNILNQNKIDKRKNLIAAFDNKFDNKILQQVIKAKSQNNKVHSSFSNNFKYKNVQKFYQKINQKYNQKPHQNKSKNFLKLTHHKNKSQANINQINISSYEQQKRLIKSISSTTKNQQYKNRVLNNLDIKNRKVHNQSSLSQRKKVSQKIQSKLNLLNNSNINQEFLKDKNHHKSNHQQIRRSVGRQDKSHIQSQNQQRLQYKYAFRTRKGKNISNPNKVNQDSILVKQNISKKDLHMIAVADGHGPSGHLVSQFVVKNLSKLFSQEINQIIKYQNKSNKVQANLISQGTLFLPKIYDKIQNSLSCSQINSVTSGCTLVNVIIQKDQILCANVGDSRAILARQLDKKNWELIYLSEDHKPSNQTQKKRILKCGGRIHSFKGQRGQNLGPLRVWLPNQNIQGLAMTRSFGDNISKSVGVTHKPEMIKVKIDEKDKFILVASDGVWQFISNQQILQLIAPYYKQRRLQQACDALLKFSYQKWTQGDDSVVDDISFVLVFLHC